MTMSEDSTAQPAASDGERDARLPLVSIVIPCYRQRDLIADALASATSQTHANVEVIVVDDGSPPELDPAPIIARFPGVRLIRKRNGGVSSARNAGLDAASGEFVVFLDGDDFLLPVAVETGLRAFREHPACAFVHGLCDRRTLDGTLLEIRPPHTGVGDHYERLLRGNFVRGIHGVMFRRSAVVEVGGFDETQRFGNDWELYLRVARTAPAFGHGQLVGTYRRHDANVNSARNSARMLRYSLLVLEKQRPHVIGRPDREAALRDGQRWVRDLFGEALARRVAAQARTGEWREAGRGALALLRHDPWRAMRRPLRALRSRLRGATAI